MATGFGSIGDPVPRDGQKIDGPPAACPGTMERGDTPRGPLTGSPRPRRRGGSVLSSVHVRRALWAFVLLGLCELVGTLGFHLLESLGWVDAFYEESMLATGQGPAIALTHASSKLFASFMGFISLGSTITTLVFTLGPILARLWHEARLAAEREALRIEAGLEHGVEELRREFARTKDPAETPAPRGGPPIR